MSVTVQIIERSDYYACQVGKKLVPIVVDDIIPGEKGGVVGRNLDTGREIFIRIKQISRIRYRIESLNEWRLKNGE